MALQWADKNTRHKIVWRTKSVFTLDQVRLNKQYKHLGVAHDGPMGSK